MLGAERGVEQPARLVLARLGVAVLEDQVEAVAAADLALQIEDIGEVLAVFGGLARGYAGGADGAHQVAADAAGDAQRRVVDGDRHALEGERAVDAGEFEAEVEGGAEAEGVERARHTARLAAPENEIEPGTRGDTADLAGDQAGGGGGIVGADAGAAERPDEAVVAADAGGRLQPRPFRRLAQRLDQAARRYRATGRCSAGERCDRVGAALVGLGGGQGRADGGGKGGDAGAGDQRAEAEGGQQAEPEPPVTAADPLAEVDGEVEVGEAVDDRGPAFRPRRRRAGQENDAAGAGRGGGQSAELVESRLIHDRPPALSPCPSVSRARGQVNAAAAPVRPSERLLRFT